MAARAYRPSSTRSSARRWAARPSQLRCTRGSRKVFLLVRVQLLEYTWNVNVPYNKFTVATVQLYIYQCYTKDARYKIASLCEHKSYSYRLRNRSCQRAFVFVLTGVQLLGTGHWQHGGSHPLRQRAAQAALAPLAARRRDSLLLRNDRATCARLMLSSSVHCTNVLVVYLLYVCIAVLYLYLMRAFVIICRSNCYRSTKL